MTSLSKFFFIAILKKTSSRIWEGKNLGILTMIFGTITCTLERSTLTTIPFSCLFSSMSKLLVFFSFFFSSSLYLVHSFCLTKRKGEARKRTLTCYLVSSCPTHFSGGTGLQTVITDECFPFPIIPNWLVSSIAAVKKKKNLN